MTEVSKKTHGPICAFPGLRVRQIENTLNMIRRKWTVPVLLEIYYGSDRFSDLLAQIPQLRTRILSLRLQEMERSRLIQKVEKGTPKYSPTEKGSALVAFLALAGKFSMQHSDN
jgi:DNA-binding HxlR family transcriptional regulator